MSTHLFTYGTLMFPDVWRIVVGRDFPHKPATLAGYEIFRVKGAHYPGIIKSAFRPSTLSPPPSVPGVLYFDLDAAALERLDRFEGDQYRRQSLPVVACDDCEIAVDAYVVPQESRHLLTDDVWTAAEFKSQGHLAQFISSYGGFRRLN